MPSRIRSVSLIVCLVAAGLPVMAQLPLRQRLVGTGALDLFGSSLAVIGDVDGDGISDFACGSPYANTPAPGAGAMRLHSGADGAPIYSVAGPLQGEALATALAGIGDVDLDGIPDLAIGIPFANGFRGRVEWRSGATGALIRSVIGAPFETLGRSIAGVGDADGDGRPDVLVGGAGVAVLCSGADGSVLETLHGASAVDDFGRSVAALGDLDGDGRGDFAVGAPSHAVGTAIVGRVIVFSGATGAVIRTLTGTTFGAFGWSIDGCGDLDHDGRSDLAVGSWAESTGYGAGRVRIFSGATGFLLRTIDAPSSGGPSAFGVSLGRAGDVDGDGTMDLVVGAPLDSTVAPQAGRVRVVSGKDGSTLLDWFGKLADDRLGFCVAGGCDCDGDGFADVLAGAIGEDAGGIDVGAVYLLSVGGARRYQSLAPVASVLTLDWQRAATGDPAQGQVVCSGAPPLAPGLFGLSLAAADAVVSGASVLIDASPTDLFFLHEFFYDGTGSAAFAAPLRIPALAGLELRCQFFVVTTPYASSNGLEVRIFR